MITLHPAMSLGRYDVITGYKISMSENRSGATADPSFREALGFWWKLGCITFGAHSRSSRDHVVRAGWEATLDRFRPFFGRKNSDRETSESTLSIRINPGGTGVMPFFRYTYSTPWSLCHLQIRESIPRSSRWPTFTVPARQLPGTRYDHPLLPRDDRRFSPWSWSPASLTPTSSPASSASRCPAQSFTSTARSSLSGSRCSWRNERSRPQAASTFTAKLGIAGIVVAAAMVPLGLMATAEWARRVAPTFPRIRHGHHNARHRAGGLCGAGHRRTFCSAENPLRTNA